MPMPKSKVKIWVYRKEDEKVYTFLASDEKGLPKEYRKLPFLIAFLIAGDYNNGILKNANKWRLEDFDTLNPSIIKLIDKRNECRKVATIEEMFAIVTQYTNWTHYDIDQPEIITRLVEAEKFDLACLCKGQENRFYVDKEVFEFARAIQDEYNHHKPEKGESWKVMTIEELEAELLKMIMHLLLAKDITISSYTCQTKRFHKSVDAGVYLMMLYSKYEEE